MRHFGLCLFLDPVELTRSHDAQRLADLFADLEPTVPKAGRRQVSRAYLALAYARQRSVAFEENVRVVGFKRSPRRRIPERSLLVEPEAGSALDLSWLFAAVNEGTERSSSQQIISVISALNALLKARRFTDLNYILGTLQPHRLSPELMLTFARLTFPVRKLLDNWYPFVRKVKKELESRELDSKRMLQGLM